MTNITCLQSSENEVFSFAEDATYQFVADHIDKLAWSCLVLPLVYIGVFSEIHAPVLVSFIICSMLPVFYRLFQKKFFHKIDINFSDKSVTIYMNRGGEIIDIPFDHIVSIKCVGYIIVKTDAKNYLFHSIHNFELCCCLNRISKIQWSILCDVFGPPRSFRISVESASK